MTIGITGHQQISATIIPWIKKTLSSKMKMYAIREGISNLAVGADQLFVKLLFQKGIPYTVVVPCKNYEQTFKSEDAVDTYKKLLSNADKIVTLPFERPTENAFYEGGKKVVELSDLMFAIWDGDHSKGKGGTADIVKLALSLKKRVLHFNVLNKTITIIE